MCIYTLVLASGFHHHYEEKKTNIRMMIYIAPIFSKIPFLIRNVRNKISFYFSLLTTAYNSSVELMQRF